MSKEKQTADASKTELTDDELEGAVGGASTCKFFRPNPEKDDDAKASAATTDGLKSR